MIKLICPICGKEFGAFPSDIKDGRKYCSKKCFFTAKTKNIITVEENCAIIHIGDKKCLIDIEDIDKIKIYHWNIREDKHHKKPYVIAETKNGRIQIHRLIMDCPKDKIVDHINHNTWDNRKINLRIVNHYTNMQNRIDAKNYHYLKEKNKFVVYFTIFHKRYIIGYTKNENKAKLFAKKGREYILNQDFESLKKLKVEFQNIGD